MDELVTVVIPALNEERFIGPCLDSVLAQDYSGLEVLVVDGGSTDATTAAVRVRMARDDRVQLLSNARRTAASSLNTALERAGGRWLVRVDAHSTIGPDYVSLAVRRLREQRWAGVGGRKDGVATSRTGKAIAVAMASRFGVGNSVYHHGTTAGEVDHVPFGSYPTDLVRRFGGWNEDVVANEDYEFDYRLRRAGHRLLFDPRLVIRWHCRESLTDLYRQYRRYGEGKADVVALHPSSVSPRHLVPPIFVAYLAGTVAVAFRRPAHALLLLSPYAAGTAAAALTAGDEAVPPVDRLAVAGAFVTMHVAWGYGFWIGAARQAVRPRGGGREPAHRAR